MELKQTVNTILGQINVTSVEMDDLGEIEFYINVSEVSDTWEESIQKAVYVDKFNNEEAQRYGVNWCDAGVNTKTRLYVRISPDWKISTALEVFYYILVVTIDRNTKKKQKIKLEAHNVKGSGQLYQLFRKYMNTELAKILLK